MIIWVCESCLGVAANMSVLRKYLAGDIVKEFWLKTINESTESTRECPSCKSPIYDDDALSCMFCNSRLHVYDIGPLSKLNTPKGRLFAIIIALLVVAGFLLWIVL